MKNNLELFVRESIGSIRKGLPKNFQIVNDIEFEISVTANESSGGGLDIKLFSGKMEGKTEVVQKIKFSVCDAEQVDNANKQNVENLIEYGGKLFNGVAQLLETFNSNDKIKKIEN